MRKAPIVALVVALGVLPSTGLAEPAANGRPVRWTAVSNTALSITGDIALGADRIEFLGAKHSYRLTEIRPLDQAEMEISAKLLGAESLKTAILYGIDVPGSARFRGGNRLCGANGVTRMIVAAWPSEGRGSLGLIAFDGSRAPYFKGWENSVGGMCATYLYQRR